LKGKKIIVGVTGSIAAYKAATLVRLLVKAGAEVRVLMTPAAQQFISPLTLATLSKHPVHSEISSESAWNNHVEMGLWADALVVAPLTASTLAKMAHGICDNILVAVYLSARCPVFFAPAMDVDMWAHRSTQDNVKRLLDCGNHLIPVGVGELASGLIGEGRMAEPEEIVATLAAHFQSADTLKGRKVMITAGPTYEPIDPVRFIGNRSSGKMGIALADEAAARGAEVTLILGPSFYRPQHPGVKTIAVQTAEEMYEAALSFFPGSDVAILSAAVADYRAQDTANQKLKKIADTLPIQLVKNPDIAAELGRLKTGKQLIVGFALETNDEIPNAKAKMEKKNFDFIVLNSLNDPGAGFVHDTNKISILHRNNKILHFELKSKTAVAADIIDEVAALLSHI
jgi:phosphopantothenoylcysteine decarboxylase/phosphopantothenate--cysteine ligase